MSGHASEGTNHRHENRLARETSPYLLQHAHNPVDWYPWGPEAHERARREGKAILLSIGYATCHWCHVMERESFEDEETAALMNERFVCIKVDREERPDVDEIYMAATVAMSGGGGWPMTVFLTPDLKPFFAGTYFPPEARYGKPSFRTVVVRLAEAWERERDDVLAQADRLTSVVIENADRRAPAPVGGVAFARASATLERTFDPTYGGFGNAPKFPHPRAIDFLLAEHVKHPDQGHLTMARVTLDGMRRGGLYDHLAGGFARYSTDERWHVPHFEKMLYDNAELARVYAEAFAATGEAEYATVTRETLDYLLREMTAPDGAFFSATDADSEGVEGKFFVWTLREIEELLSPDDAALFAAAYDVSELGNWEDGHNVLQTPRSIDEVARERGVDPAEARRRLHDARATLLARRKERVPPITDDKILVAWNALAIAALAVAGARLDEPRYVEAAARAAAAIDASLVRPDGGLFRTCRAGVAHLDAYLEDYAYLADALVDLFEASGDMAHLRRARALADRFIADFGDDTGGFFFTSKAHEALLVRTSDATDNAIPSAQAVAARALARLGAHLDDAALTARAQATVAAYGALAERAPRAFLTLLSVADLLAAPPVEVAVVGPRDAAETVALRRALAGVYLPHRVIAIGEDEAHPLLQGRVRAGTPPTAFVCRSHVCDLPVTRPEALVAQLTEAREAAARERREALPSKVE